MKQSYVKATIGLYSNYFLLGMVNIILSSNMASLTEKWGTTSTGISYIIAAIGFGKLLTYSGFGLLSDKIGRKPLLVFSSIAMALFLVSIPLLPNYKWAFLFAILAGIANAAMDAGSYPALVEIFTKSANSANVLVKAFIATGATILPFIILFLSEKNLFFGYSFFLVAAIYLITMVVLVFSQFPKVNQVQYERTEEVGTMPRFSKEPKLFKEGLSLIVIGFTSTALFTVAQIWLPSYGEDAVFMPTEQSVKLLSYYSIGSLVSVLFLAFVLKKWVQSTTILVLYPIVTLVTVTVILTVKVPIVLIVASFFLGISTAGIFQLAVTLMNELFWTKKGTVTGMVSTAGSIAAVVMPLVTGLIAKSGAINYIFIFDGFVAAIGIIAGIYILIKYNVLTKQIN